MFHLIILILPIGKIIFRELLIAQGLIAALLVQPYNQEEKIRLSILGLCVLTATLYLFLY